MNISGELPCLGHPALCFECASLSQDHTVLRGNHTPLRFVDAWPPLVAARSSLLDAVLSLVRTRPCVSGSLPKEGDARPCGAHAWLSRAATRISLTIPQLHEKTRRLRFTGAPLGLGGAPPDFVDVRFPLVTGWPDERASRPMHGSTFTNEEAVTTSKEARALSEKALRTSEETA